MTGKSSGFSSVLPPELRAPIRRGGSTSVDFETPPETRRSFASRLVSFGRLCLRTDAFAAGLTRGNVGVFPATGEANNNKRY
jgi:hypothetical protein